MYDRMAYMFWQRETVFLFSEVEKATTGQQRKP